MVDIRLTFLAANCLLIASSQPMKMHQVRNCSYADLSDQVSQLQVELAAMTQKYETLKRSCGGDDWVDETYRDYLIKATPSTGTFAEVQSMCKQMGGTLLQKAMLKYYGGRNYKEDIKTAMSYGGDIWYHVGLTERDGAFRFIDAGEGSQSELRVDVTVFRWQPGEPGGQEEGGAGRCVQVSAPYLHLISFGCDDPVRGLCEIPL